MKTYKVTVQIDDSKSESLSNIEAESPDQAIALVRRYLKNFKTVPKNLKDSADTVMMSAEELPLTA